MIDGVITSQTGGRQFDGTDITKYSMFVGGVNATNNALRQYSPLVNGYCRLFMVRPPYALLHLMAGGNPAYYYSSDSLFIQFKHILEYMNRSVSGIQAKTLEPASTPLQGGFAGRQFSLPTITKEATTEIQIGVYEFSGCPLATLLDSWMNMIGDENSGLATYGGHISGGRRADKTEVPLYSYSSDSNPIGIEFNEANHTAEFIYVLHDRSGAQVEKAMLLADCWPKSIEQNNIMDMPAGGTHDLVQYTIGFNCIAYSSPIITSIANDLLKQYRIVSNHLNFNPELGDAVYGNNSTPSNIKINRALGAVPSDSAVGTGIGNLPVYNPLNTPLTTKVNLSPGSVQQGTPQVTARHYTEAKLAGNKNVSFNPEELYGTQSGHGRQFDFDSTATTRIGSGTGDKAYVSSDQFTGSGPNPFQTTVVGG